MDLHTWLDLPENTGKAVWLANALGRSKTAVSLWRNDGIPLALIPRVAALVGEPVTVEDMLLHAMQCKAVELAGPELRALPSAPCDPALAEQAATVGASAAGGVDAAQSVMVHS